MGNLFLEFRNWGWNATTVGFLGTVFFTIFQGWGLTKQLKTIKEKRSGKSIPVFLYGSFVGVYFAFGVYGYRCHSLAMILNGLLGLLYLRVYIAAVQFPDSDRWRAWHSIFLLLIPAMKYTSHPQGLMGLILLVATSMLFQAPIEIYQKKSAGAVDLRYLATFTASASFWVIYSIGIMDAVVFASNVVAVAVMFVTFRLWFKYRPAVLAGR